MSERFTVIDELVHERFTVVARGSWTHVLHILGFAALCFLVYRMIPEGPATRLPSLELDLGLMLGCGAFGACVCGYLLVLPAWELLRPARVVTLTRGRVEVARGRRRRVFPRRAIRFAELRYSARHGKYPDYDVALWLSVELPDDATTGVRDGWAQVLRMRLDYWGETESQQFKQLNDALALLGLRERLAPPSQDGFKPVVT